MVSSAAMLNAFPSLFTLGNNTAPMEEHYEVSHAQAYRLGRASRIWNMTSHTSRSTTRPQWLMQRKLFLGMHSLGMIPGKRPALKFRTGLDHSGRLNLSLAGYSSAEPLTFQFNNTKFNSVIYIYNLSKLSAVYQGRKKFTFIEVT